MELNFKEPKKLSMLDCFAEVGLPCCSACLFWIFLETTRATIPLCVVTDAKDVFDKSSSDTPTYGSRKSLAFTVAWIRQVLGKPCTQLKRTSTENMFIDVGTKDMEYDHLHKIIESCKWSVSFNKAFIKQKQKKLRAVVFRESGKLIGEVLDETSLVFPHLAQLSSSLVQ